MEKCEAAETFGDESGAADRPRGRVAHNDSCTVFVSNLDYSTTADQLREIFSKVRRCRLLSDTTSEVSLYIYLLI